MYDENAKLTPEVISEMLEVGIITPERAEELKLALDDETKAQTERLEQFGFAVQKWIDEAVQAREESGIESRWREDLRNFYGSDFSDKHMNMTEEAAEGIRGEGSSRERLTRSKITVNITRPKTNAAMARLADMLLPTDDKNWGVQPTPDPTLARDSKDETVLTRDGVPMVAEDGEPLTIAKHASKEMDAAQRSAQGMERAIDDQTTECRYNAELRKGLWYFTTLGTMVMRGPFANVTKKHVWRRDQATGKWKMQSDTKTAPASVCVPLWNYYPDPACGGDITKARYHVEQWDYNARTLRDLRDQPGFIRQNINECLLGGPQSRNSQGRKVDDTRYLQGEYLRDDDNTFNVFIVHGYFTKGQLSDAGVEECECPDGADAAEWREEQVTGCVFMCNGRPIKAYLNPLDSGELPYDVATYEKIDGQVFGVGIPFILRNPQRVVTAAWRMLMDNAALASGSQIVIKRGAIEPADGSWSIRGTKIWYASEKTEDVGHAFKTFQLDLRSEELFRIIEWALRFAEDESSLPSLLEGQQGSAPETVGGMTMLTNNANAVLRRLVKQFDDQITKPHITRYFDWNMQYSEDESIKGDFSIDARGSSVLMVRDIQKQSLLQIGSWVVHPNFIGFHKKAGYEWLRTMYEANHLQADDILVGEEEADAIIKQQQESAKQAPQDPRIATAQIKQQTDLQRLKSDTDDAQRERDHDMKLAELQYQTKLMDYATKREISIEQARNDLAKTVMQINSSREEMQLARQTGSGI